MKALFFDETLALTDIPKPERKPGQSLIKVLKAGICNTDIELMKGYMDFKGVPGHEFVGVVEESDDNSLINQRVVGEINASCGHCIYCHQGLARHCPNRSVLGILNHQGAFAEYITLPEQNLHPVPHDITDETAVFTEPLAAALEILEQVHIPPESYICIIGDGKLGILITMVMGINFPNVYISGKHENKIKIAVSTGAKILNSLSKKDRRFDFIIEASGSANGFNQALSMIKPRGTIILKSTYKGSLSVDFSLPVINEINLIGSRCGPFEPALHLLGNKLIDTPALISAIFPIDDFKQAFDESKKPKNIKVILDIS